MIPLSVSEIAAVAELRGTTMFTYAPWPEGLKDSRLELPYQNGIMPGLSFELRAHTLFLGFADERARTVFRAWASAIGYRLDDELELPVLEIDRSAPVYHYDPAVGF